MVRYGEQAARRLERREEDQGSLLGLGRGRNKKREGAEEKEGEAKQNQEEERNEEERHLPFPGRIGGLN